MDVYDFGWSNIFSHEVSDLDTIARITSVHKNYSKAISTIGEINIYLSGKLLNTSFSLATGDFIEMSPIFIDEQNKPSALVKKLLTRKSAITRMVAGNQIKEQVIVANLDIVFIVTSTNSDLNLNRIQRYVLLALDGNVLPILVLSKIDLVENPDLWLETIKQRFPKLETLAVSVKSTSSLKKLKEKMAPGVTAAFVGSSGVGKSSLVNELLGLPIQTVKEIRENDSKGKHTTSHRELFFLPQAGMIIDTAGLREIKVLASEKSIEDTFDKISRLAEHCKFSDCRHNGEPGCQIAYALEKGEIDLNEFQNYLKLEKEASFNERKINKSIASKEKKRWKKVSQDIKAMKKLDKKLGR
jgi:ribosome biogenesis GTPase